MYIFIFYLFIILFKYFFAFISRKESEEVDMAPSNFSQVFKLFSDYR